ncbi:MAG: membrane integrity-associated transporter subunit PqiC [Archangium sp.]|nr:membrane integrity-associated transporter subunit PqiC [Archangium sp.]
MLLLNACALFSKGEVPTRRYYTPTLTTSPSSAVVHSHAELRLGRITAGAAIGERIMFRQSPQEVGFYEDRVWTEKPQAYLQRELTRVLFEELGLRNVMRGAGPTLDVELLTFEEVLAPRHLGRVTVTFSLSDERVVSMQETMSIERPIPPASTPTAEGQAVAQAMGEALHDTVAQISQRVMDGLAATNSGSAPCPVADTKN